MNGAQLLLVVPATNSEEKTNGRECGASLVLRPGRSRRIHMTMF